MIGKFMSSDGVDLVSQDGLVKVAMEWICEGIEGDYREDTEDIPLVRFTVYRKVDGEWVECDDSSYCTQIPADLPTRDIRRLGQVLLDRVYEPARDHGNIKKLCERLSWIDPSWGTRYEESGWTMDEQLLARRKKK